MTAPARGGRGRAGRLDAVVVGAGPNGLVAAAALAGAGRRVLVLEAAERVGGGTRSAELTLPGFVHDVCSAVHPLAVMSEAMRSLPLAQHGLSWVHPDAPLAHVLDGGRAAVVERSVGLTAERFGPDTPRYRRLVEPFAGSGGPLADAVLALPRVPRAHPVLLARFGVAGIRSAMHIARRFSTEEPAAVVAGLAAHSMLSLRAPITAGYALLLGSLAHASGWPVARGGSGAIATALAAVVEARGGRIECGARVARLRDLPPARITVLDVTPRQLLALDDDGRLPARYRRSLERFRYGPGVFKIDWALDAPVPWTNPAVARAATVHVGASAGEIAASEDEVQRGRHPERPFVLFAQPSLFDASRAPSGKHTGWAYCHVPTGSTRDMTEAVEAQIERFAPGFRERILARHTTNAAQLEHYDENYVGGDINGGVADLRGLLARPRLSLHPWATPARGLYLCSSSTPPGGGVHGMCGWHAAHLALARDR